MKGIDNYGNIKITGYYTPIVEARKTKTNEFKYPIYSMPLNYKKNQSLPERKEIYNGILNNKYILAYSNSLINNFIMEIQGSAFIDYGNNKPLTFFSYAGKNGWPYRSIGQVLIHRGDIKKNNMSMKTIKNWCKNHTQKEVQDLFEENKSFVFFKETQRKKVYGASSVPLIAKTSVAVDRSIIKNGSVILLQNPILNKKGIFTHKYEMRLVIALDVGGAIKGQHFDIYEGIGKKPGILAGFYNHFGYAWILSVTAKNESIAIIIARFNEFINKNLLSGALDVLKRIGQVNKENIFKIYVPGTYEIPVVASYIAKSGKYNAIIVLGTIIQGKTDHFKYIANDTTNNLSRISTQYFIPITSGILTTKNIEQSIERCGTKMGNKGSEAAFAALEMINVMKFLKKSL